MMSLDAWQDVQTVVIGGSAGAIEALTVLLPAFPSNCRAAVLVVMHLPRERPSLLTELFAHRCALPVREAQDKEPIEPKTVYFAPPDYHLLIEHDRTLALSVDEAVNFSRPSIDVLFESAAEVYGRQLCGVILSGASDDGAAGLRAIRNAGGLRLVQDPAHAQVARMPEAAIQADPDCHRLSLDELAALFRSGRAGGAS